MLIYAVRCGLSTLDGHSGSTPPVAAIKAAHLTRGGRRQARVAGKRLTVQYGVSPRENCAATSCFKSAEETALQMGFVKSQVVSCHLLDIVDCNLVDIAERPSFNLKDRSEGMVQKAQHILGNPPMQSIWITHGWVIAGLTILLGVRSHYESVMPRHCEIRVFAI